MRVLLEPFGDPFMRRALLEAVLLGVAGAVVGAHVLLRRRAYLAEVLQHGVFPGIAVAFVVGQPLLIGAVVAAVATVGAVSVVGRRRGVDPDSAMALVIAATFAVGVVVVSHRSGYQSDLTTLLFGRILDVDGRQLVETAVVVALVMVVVVGLGKELVLGALDPLHATALGYPVGRLDLVLDLAVAAVVIVAVRALGTVLVVAFLVTPSAAARLVAHRVSSLVAVATVVAVASAWIGLGVSYEASVHHGIPLAAGATVVLAMTTAFLVTAGLAPLRHRRVRTATG